MSLIDALVTIGAILGWISFFRLRKLQREVDQLRRGDTPAQPPVAPEQRSSGWTEPEDQTPDQPSPAITPPPTRTPNEMSAKPSPPPLPAKPNPFVENLKQHWMIWLGGLCVALAGVFMVRYSIDAGLLGPKARVAMALITGLGLHAAAEWLLRKRGAHPAFAALAGGASITLFAALLAGLHLYELLSPGFAFVLLAVVSLLTMLLALRQGPMLAIIGLLGGYIVPVLVSTGSGNILAALVYAWMISVAGLLLQRWVYRPWLWWGVVAGGLGWWALSLNLPQADGWRGPYLALLGYGLLALPGFDWLLRYQQRNESTRGWISSLQGGQSLQEAPLPWALLLLLIAQAVSIVIEGLQPLAVWSWVPLTLLLLWSARQRDALVLLGWITVLAQCAAWLAVGAMESGLRFWPLHLPESQQAPFLALAAWMALIGALFGWFGLRSQRHEALWASLMLLTPLLWLALAYVMTEQFTGDWQWAICTVIVGLGYVGFAGQRLRAGQSDDLVVWLVLAGHFAWSLAAAMLLREASLTLAIAAQVLSLAWVMRRFRLAESGPQLGWLLKLVLAIVVARLTLNPWLLSYPADVHWSLYTYGGATVFCALAVYTLRKEAGFIELRKWLELATLHLLVLTIWSELRYQLYGDIFMPHYGLLEAAINTNLWASLGLIYNRRAKNSQHLASIYRLASHALLIAALGNYALTLTVLNPLLSDEPVSPTPIWNILLLAYGLPVLIGILAWRELTGVRRKIASLLVPLAAFVFINLEIRHLWHGSVHGSVPVHDAELYTYSVVWLVFAVVMLLAGSARYGIQVYRAGIGLLGLVIAKIFLIDMAGLEGLLRVASFMGLGLSLLGLAYLLQNVNRRGLNEEVHSKTD